ncbi:MAG: HepT-like ribonuclease domain-containing protein [Cyanobacteria bacterium J06555_13]
MRQDQDRLSDILDAIESIERYLTKDREAFEADELVQVWMLHYLQIIGEAARSTSASLKESYSSVPWESIVGFRNLVVHEYFRVDLDVVWGIVTDDLSTLKGQVRDILSTLD